MAEEFKSSSITIKLAVEGIGKKLSKDTKTPERIIKREVPKVVFKKGVSDRKRK